MPEALYVGVGRQAVFMHDKLREQGVDPDLSDEDSKLLEALQTASSDGDTNDALLAMFKMLDPE